MSRSRLSVIREEGSVIAARPSIWAKGPPASKAKSTGSRYAPSPAPVAPSKPISSPVPARVVPTPVPAAIDAWPVEEDFIRPRYEPPKPILTEDQVRQFGDKIVKLIGAEVKMCRGFETKPSETYIRLQPSPPYERALNLYVIEKVYSLGQIRDIKWDFGRDVITIAL